jgi:hypothetical protein
MPDVADHTVLGGRVSLTRLIRQGTVPYQTDKRAKIWLDGLRVPYVIVRRQRHYRPDDIKAAALTCRQAEHPIQMAISSNREIALNAPSTLNGSKAACTMRFAVVAISLVPV